MKIWHVVTEVPIPGSFTGGMGCHVWNVSKEQAALGHEVEVFCTVREEEELQGVRFRPWQYVGPKFQSELCFQQHIAFETSKKLSRIAKAEGYPGILHCHEWDSAAIVDDLSERLGVPWVSTLHLSNTLNSQHMTPFYTETSAYYLWWEQEMLRRANHSIAISDYYAGWMRMFTSKPITTILNGVNVSDFEGGNAPKLPTDKKTAFFHGRLCMQKGLALIVEAAKKRDDIWWVLAGPMAGKEDGRCLEDGLLKDLKDLERQGKVMLPGMLSQSEIGAWLRVCDVAVYPHLRAPFDCAVLEAMACGALVVTTGVDAIGEYAIDCDNCRICEPSADSLLHHIELALKRNSYCKVNAKRLALEYTWKNTTLKTLEVYEGVIHGNENYTRPERTSQSGQARGLLLDQISA